MNSSSSPAFAGIFVFYIIIIVIAIVANWRIFTKAHKPGWASIIPIYNIYVLLTIARKPGWWIILLLIPVVNIVILILVSIGLAKAFGKSTAFGVIGLFLFSLIGYLILAFGSAQYVLTDATPQPSTPPQPIAPPVQPVTPMPQNSTPPQTPPTQPPTA